MFSVFKNAFKTPDLRSKIFYTLLILLIFRVGAAITVPFLDTDALQRLFPAFDPATAGAGANTMFDYFNILSGGAFSKATIFAMSVTPYINASIIMQLLTVAIPALERMQKEGEEGRKRIGTITRYVTVSLGLLQGTAFYVYLRNADPAPGAESTERLQIVKYMTGWESWFTAVVIVLVFTAGSALMMWLGEQINEKGIGNGISMLLFAGILSGFPTTITTLSAYIKLGLEDASMRHYIYLVPVVVVLFLAIIAFIVVLNEAERRIPVQYAKRVVGRKMYGGQSTHMPIKVNMSGVLPIIFASTILSIPQTIQMFIPSNNISEFWQGFFNAFSTTGWLYGVLYFLMIIGFSYFYISIQYNPLEMANNLKKNNGAIPGYRPGKPTSDFIARIISKIVLIGALFLGVIAILPIVFGAATNINISMGGTSIMIVVGVAIETMRSLESQMLMRHYKGFLE